MIKLNTLLAKVDHSQSMFNRMVCAIFNNIN